MSTVSINEILKTIKDNTIIIDELSREIKIKKEALIDIINNYLNNNNMDKENKVNFKDTTGVVKIYVDGGSRGNPGEAGAGVLLNCKGNNIGYYYYLGNRTNNEAEYSALIYALELADKKNFDKIEIFSDSELICNQINGLYKVKNENLKKYYDKVIVLKQKFNKFSITHIVREKNKEADKLANRAMDLKKDGEIEFTVVK